MEPLPEQDVEIDGEPIMASPMDRLKNFKCGPSVKSAKSEQEDLGFASMSPGSSLECASLKSVDKAPVQCSERHGDEPTAAPRAAGPGSELDEVLKKVEEIRLDEDEGIRSFESNASDASEPVEIDLFEQDMDGDTLLHMAIVSGAIKVALVLIDMAEDLACLNLQNDLFQTPLHMAIITEHYEVATHLVKKGADVHRCDKQGNTPLHLACRKGEKAVIRALLETFGDNKTARQKYFAAKNCEGLTCLHLAAEQKHFLIMGYLFAKGADVNMGDAKSGRTILHYAVEKKDMESVVLLLTHPDIKVDCKTFKGETPLVLAYWRNYQDIVKKLKSKGAFFSYELFEDSDEDLS